MVNLPWTKKKGRFQTYGYGRLGEDDSTSRKIAEERKRYWRRMWIVSGALWLFCLLLFLSSRGGEEGSKMKSCDSVEFGYQCRPHISHYWGQYSPYFSVPKELLPDVPQQCTVTFAQVLSRHGARDPTLSKTIVYNETIRRIQQDVRSFKGRYAFLKEYKYRFGADQLSDFGRKQMWNSGVKFYERYADLAQEHDPFIRSSGQERVVESGEYWAQGFHAAKVGDRHSDKGSYPYRNISIPEEPGVNNTLSHGNCNSFERDEGSIARDAQAKWVSIFMPPISKRLEKDLPGLNVTYTEILYLMDMCPFDTVADPKGKTSPFCDLFTENEWRQYNHYYSLNKYYGYSWGNGLAPAQGIGFTNELISRMTGKPVKDETSTNRTLDSNPKTFPIGGKHVIFADFSHDNDMTTIFSALGLYNDTKPLSNTSVQSIEDTAGYSAAWTVPFAARAYFEKMNCDGQEEELVRVLVNDRVVPLKGCGADRLGRCTLSRFVESLGFARSGGNWAQCEANQDGV